MAKRKRYKHNLSNTRLTTIKGGWLCPIQVFEALPGDTIQLKTSMLIRCTPLVAPVMHPVELTVHHWFVPNRIMWDGWEDFIRGISLVPFVGTFKQSTMHANEQVLFDRLGIDLTHIGLNEEFTINKFALEAYRQIWNHFYRDEDLTPEIAEGSYPIHRVAWGKDNFTTARPTPQFGNEVFIPVADLDLSKLRIVGNGNVFLLNAGDAGNLASVALRANGSSTQYHDGRVHSLQNELFSTDRDLYRPTAVDQYERGLAIKQYDPSGLSDPSKLKAGEGLSVRELRRYSALQRYAERLGRYGHRYDEFMRAQYGVNIPSGLDDLPVYIGGGKSTMQFSEVMQTGQDGNNPVGTMRGHGIGALKSRKARFTAKEHGIVMTLMFVRPKSIYLNGVDRHFFKANPEDYYNPLLEDIGQGKLYESDISFPAEASTTKVFGYVPKYDEYRFVPSKCTGQMRDYFKDWHFAREFTGTVLLNDRFIQCIPTLRPFANQADDHFLVMANNRTYAKRLVKPARSMGRVM